ncbi:MAG: hypothetical protein VX536_07330 [Pseudomonadota bacterium]|nr:hypothetical protein [Pseudomonadota bacterium]
MQYTEPNLLTALAEGSVDFAYGVSPLVFLSLVVLIVVGVWFGYRKTTRPLSSPWKAFFIALRASVLSILLFCLLRPVITTLQVAPQETYLGVLIDDSQSMAIADMPAGQTRREAMREGFYGGGVLDELA